MRYWNIEEYPELLSSLYTFVVGMRSNGKSYSVKNYLVKQAIEHGKHFLILRKYITEKIDMDTYFDDSLFGDKIVCTENKYLYDKTVIGYVRSISQYKRIKSAIWSDVEYILYEEFLSLDEYEDDEYSKFVNILSSVFRNRNGHVICIGNLETYSQMFSNPLLSRFSFDIDELKQGDTIYSNYRYNGVKINACLHWCENCYDDVNEVPEMMRIPMNDIAISGNINNYDSDVFECEYKQFSGCLCVFPSENVGRCLCLCVMVTEFSKYYGDDSMFVEIIEFDIDDIPERAFKRTGNRYDKVLDAFVRYKKRLSEYVDDRGVFFKYIGAKTKAIVSEFIDMSYDSYIKKCFDYLKKLDNLL